MDKHSRFCTALSTALFLSSSATSTLAQTSASIAIRHVQPYTYTIHRGGQLWVNYRFKATTPTTGNLKVFVHLRDANGIIVAQHDHWPKGIQTSQWLGDISYEDDVWQLPSTLAAGRYTIVAGLYDTTNGARQALSTQVFSDPNEPTYTSEHISNDKSYIIGQVNIHEYTTPIYDANFTCNGTDVSSQLKAAISSLPNGSILKLPFGKCIYGSDPNGGNLLRVDGKTNVQIVGMGAPSTILETSSPNNSAFVVANNSSNVSLRDFTIRINRSPSDSRSDDANTSGFNISQAANISIKQVRVEGPKGGGIHVYKTSTIEVSNSFVRGTLADGIHFTGMSTGITARGNTVINSGDDGISSIGYYDGNFSGRNNTVLIEENRVIFPSVFHGSGIAVEGSNNVTIRKNYVQKSGSAGIRVASLDGIQPIFENNQWVNKPFRTDGVTNVVVHENNLQDVGVITTTGHPAILVYSNALNMDAVDVYNNTVQYADQSYQSAVDTVRYWRDQSPSSGYWPIISDSYIYANKSKNQIPNGRLAKKCINLVANGLSQVHLNKSRGGVTAGNANLFWETGLNSYSNCTP